MQARCCDAQERLAVQARVRAQRASVQARGEESKEKVKAEKEPCTTRMYAHAQVTASSGVEHRT